MNIIESSAKTILIKRKKIDSWFISAYGMNLYRGCSHNCAYCDGRAENYYVKGEFGVDVEAKTNAVEILESELDPTRKRKPMQRGFILVGGGVCDTYEPIELKYELTRKALELIKKFKHPVHILTKSPNVERDIDLLSEINRQTKAIVSFSFSTVDEKIAKHFEPGVPPPYRRFEAMKKLKRAGISTGIFFMPVIPFVTDSPQQIKNMFDAAKYVNADYIVFGGMTLKSGRQSDHFYEVLSNYDESLLTEYSMIYNKDKWGNASPDYYQYINQLFLQISRHYSIPKRIPAYLYKNTLDINNFVSVMMDQLDYLVKLNYGKSNYGYAAHSISQLEQPITELRYHLKQIQGVGPDSEKIIREILDSGTSSYYNKLL